MTVDDGSLASFLSAVFLAMAVLDTVWSWVASRLEDAGTL